MPKFVVPRRSGAHRVAAIALYRALLTQCTAAPLQLAEDQRSTLRNIVRNKFRRNRHVHSTRLLKLSFTAGYDLLDTLDRAATSTTTTTPNDAATSATTLLTTLLLSAPPHLTRSPWTTKPPQPARLNPSPETCPPPPLKMLAVRPRPASALGGTGIRRVPKILSANTFPILRLSKPQPRSLSRVITDLVKQRQRRLDLRDTAHAWAEMGALEDDWDRLLWDMHGVGDEDDVAPAPVPMARRERDGDDERELPVDLTEEAGTSWGWEARKLVRMLAWQLNQQRVKTMENVQRMQGIVDRETEMARREREQRKMKRVAEARRKKDFADIVGQGDARSR